MDSQLHRSQIVGVIRARASRRRPSRGVRRHNRRVIGEARRGQVPKFARQELPWASKAEIGRRARNSAGSCPACRCPGVHPMANFRRNPDGMVIELRQCRSCGAKFSDIPTSPPPFVGQGPSWEFGYM